jgi:hypothetical protein
MPINMDKEFFMETKKENEKVQNVCGNSDICAFFREDFCAGR